ncbi:MAG: type II toxin-antitoxin system VapC family toxin, partial [Natrialbaceae archaeon]
EPRSGSPTPIEGNPRCRVSSVEAVSCLTELVSPVFGRPVEWPLDGRLPVTDRTADEATALQEALTNRGVPADHPDVLVAASAREHGGVFATAEKHFWKEDVRSVLSVAEYDPY